MNIVRARKWLGLWAGGGMALQITACLGSDPQFFVTSSVVNTLISTVISRLIDLLLGGFTV